MNRIYVAETKEVAGAEAAKGFGLTRPVNSQNRPKSRTVQQLTSNKCDRTAAEKKTAFNYKIFF